MLDCKIPHIMTFDLYTTPDQRDDQKGTSHNFLDYEVNELLKYIRFTVEGKAINVDGYILVSDQKLYRLRTLEEEN